MEEVKTDSLSNINLKNDEHIQPVNGSAETVESPTDESYSTNGFSIIPKTITPTAKWEDVLNLKSNDTDAILAVTVDNLSFKEYYELQHKVQSWFAISEYYSTLVRASEDKPPLVNNLNIVDEHNYINMVDYVDKTLLKVEDSLKAGELEIVRLIKKYYKDGKITISKTSGIKMLLKRIIGIK